MSTTTRSHRRCAALAVLVPLTGAALLAGAGPASAIVYEGDPTSTSCLRIERLPGAAPAGNPHWVSHGHVAVLRHGDACSGVED